MAHPGGVVAVARRTASRPRSRVRRLPTTISGVPAVTPRTVTKRRARRSISAVGERLGLGLGDQRDLVTRCARRVLDRASAARLGRCARRSPRPRSSTPGRSRRSWRAPARVVARHAAPRCLVREVARTDTDSSSLPWVRVTRRAQPVGPRRQVQRAVLGPHLGGEQPGPVAQEVEVALVELLDDVVGGAVHRHVGRQRRGATRWCGRGPRRTPGCRWPRSGSCRSAISSSSAYTLTCGGSPCSKETSIAEIVPLKTTFSLPAGRSTPRSCGRSRRWSRRGTRPRRGSGWSGSRWPPRAGRGVRRPLEVLGHLQAQQVPAHVGLQGAVGLDHRGVAGGQGRLRHRSRSPRCGPDSAIAMRATWRCRSRSAHVGSSGSCGRRRRAAGRPGRAHLDGGGHLAHVDRLSAALHSRIRRRPTGPVRRRSPRTRSRMPARGEVGCTVADAALPKATGGAARPEPGRGPGPPRRGRGRPPAGAAGCRSRRRPPAGRRAPSGPARPPGPRPPARPPPTARWAGWVHPPGTVAAGAGKAARGAPAAPADRVAVCWARAWLMPPAAVTAAGSVGSGPAGPVTAARRVRRRRPGRRRRWPRVTPSPTPADNEAEKSIWSPASRCSGSVMPAGEVLPGRGIQAHAGGEVRRASRRRAPCRCGRRSGDAGRAGAARRREGVGRGRCRRWPPDRAGRRRTAASAP